MRWRTRIALQVLLALLVASALVFFHGGANSYFHEVAAWLGIHNSIVLEARAPSIDPMAIQVVYVRIDEEVPPMAVLANGRGVRFPGAEGAYEFRISYRGGPICSAGYFTDSRFGGNQYRVCCAEGPSGVMCSVDLDGLPIPCSCGGYPVRRLCRD